LSAAEFEQIVGELLRREGWDVEETGGHGEPDGNVDLRIRRGNQERLVQCKRWMSSQVGVDEVRKLAGALLREGLQRGDGILVTSSDFTRPQSPKQPQPASSSSEATIYSADSTDAGAMELLDGSDDITAAYQCRLRNADDPGPLTIRLVDPLSKHGCDGKRDLGRTPSRARANPQLALKHGTLARERPQRLEPLSVRG